MLRAVVCGAGGFIGGHLVIRLKNLGYWVKAVDLKNHEYMDIGADEFIIGDLRDPKFTASIIDDTIDEVYQLAADMGGALYVFSGENDANIMHSSALINLNICHVCVGKKLKIFYSSSACMYPEHNQLDPDNPKCSEDSAYPANPDSEYGWEKLFSERLYLAYMRNYGMNIKIARFHNIFGPYGTWCGGREKAPAAICRKIAIAKNHDEIEIWGDGLQTRSFLIVDECIDGILILMNHPDFYGPVNIGSEEMININDLARMVINISGKKLTIKNINVNHTGVRGRNSDNKLIREKLNWQPSKKLIDGMQIMYEWIKDQVKNNSII